MFEEHNLKLWSSIFDFIIFKMWLNIDEHECDFLVSFAYISLLIFPFYHWRDCV